MVMIRAQRHVWGLNLVIYHHTIPLRGQAFALTYMHAAHTLGVTCSHDAQSTYTQPQLAAPTPALTNPGPCTSGMPADSASKHGNRHQPLAPSLQTAIGSDGFRIFAVRFRHAAQRRLQHHQPQLHGPDGARRGSRAVRAARCSAARGGGHDARSRLCVTRRDHGQGSSPSEGSDGSGHGNDEVGSGGRLALHPNDQHLRH